MSFVFPSNAKISIDYTNAIVGIGTTQPTANLHIVGTTIFNGNLTLINGSLSLGYSNGSGSGGLNGTLTTSAQPNITLLGTLTNLTVNTGLYVLSNGNVGMGTSTPIANLHVIGPVNLRSSIGETGLYMRTGNVGIGTSSPAANLHVLGFTALVNSANTTGLYVSSVGNVGIGTSVPTANLTVLGTSQLLGNAATTGLYIASTGNVGIGTSTPTANLTVLGTSQLLGNGAATGLYVDSNGNVGIGTAVPTANLHVIGTSQLLGNSSTSGLYVISNGNVGIATAIPTANLHVVGPVNLISSNAATGLYMRTGNVGIGTSTPMANLHVLGYTALVNTANTTGLYVNTLGNVGIGTSTPVANLHVLGYTALVNTANTTGLFVTSIGNVGIGTSTPAANLHVLGYTQLLGNLNTTGLYVTSTGNVGIVTNTPTANLQVYGTTALLGNVSYGGLYVSTAGLVAVGNIGTTSNLTIFSNSIYNTNDTGSNALLINSANVSLYCGVDSGNSVAYISVSKSGSTLPLILNNRGGNIGIGTSNPQFTLDVNGTSRYSNVTVFQGISTTNNYYGATIGMDGNNCSLQLNANANTSATSYINFSNVGTSYSGKINYDVINNFMSIYTNTVERVRINASGNVGIGTTSPLANLHIYTGLTTIPATSALAANIGGPLGILHGTNDGFNRLISALDNNMSSGSTRYISLGQYPSALNQADIGFYYASAGSLSNYMSFGFYGYPRILNITGSGYVGIGTTNPSYPLYVATAGTTYSGTNKYYFGNNNSGTALLAAGSSATNVSLVIQGDMINIAGNYIAYSDRRIKNNIKEISTKECLTLIKQLKVVEHSYIDNIKNSETKINFIAQDVEKIIPKAVSLVKDFIPSIYSEYTCNKIQNNKLCIFDIIYDFLQVGTKLKLYTINCNNVYLVLEKELEINNEIFVYGHETDDCRTLNNNTLYTLCIGAVQEINKKLEDRISNLEKRLTLLENKVS
jgi:hypothetical protein